MITQALHRQPIALDSVRHRRLTVPVPIDDWSIADKLNALFVAAAEFADASRDFPVVFVRAGKDDDGQEQIAPIAVFGLTREQNLYVDDGRWRARYMPVVLRTYPFCIARVDASQYAVCVDLAAADESGAAGAPVFDAEGRPTDVLKVVQPQLEALEADVQRTRLVGRRLLELDLLRDMRFDVTLPDGSTHSVDGFLTVDDQKMTALPDATVGELHRTGILGLVHLHWASLGNMRRLVEWHAERLAAAQPAAAPAAP